MRSKGFVMIVLTALPGAWMLGCLRSSSLPPTSAISRVPRQSVPNITQARPAPSVPLTRPRPNHLGNKLWQPSAPRGEWKYLVLHHTASNRGSVESIHQAHLKNKDQNGTPWLGIGYHFVIGNGHGMPDGAIESTFRWHQQRHGAHAGVDEYNQHGIGIALVGNFDEGPPSSAQLAAVKRLVARLTSEYAITSDRILGHGDVKATACPGRYFPLEEVRQSSALTKNLSNASPTTVAVKETRTQ